MAYLRLSALSAVVVAVLLKTSFAECPNACSGHGSCGTYDQCTCARNWDGSDCSLRICPYGTSHVTTPQGDLNGDTVVSDAGTTVIDGSTKYLHGTWEGFPSNNQAHAYMECSNKGLCDRSTATCDCFTGYEGSACQRSVCPNDCSSHGTCEYIKEIQEDKEFGEGISLSDFSAIGGTAYELWDKHSAMGCKCDAGFKAADCSERICIDGVDPLYTGALSYEKAIVEVSVVDRDNTGNFTLHIYDNMGEEYIIPGIPYGNESMVNLQDGPGSCAFIMSYFPPDRNMDTNNARPFCTLQDLVTNTRGAALTYKYVFDWNKKNPGFVRDLWVSDIFDTENEVRDLGDVQIKYYVTRQGHDSSYTDDGTYGFTLPGYVVSFQGNVLTLSEDVSFWLNDTLTDLGTFTNFVKFDTENRTTNASAYEVSSISDEWLETATNSKIFKRISKVTLATALDLSIQRKINDHSEEQGYVRLIARLNPADRYVDECSGRGKCNRQTGLCECFSGYTKGNCDTQSMMGYGRATTRTAAVL